jgi:hypothetical protein
VVSKLLEFLQDYSSNKKHNGSTDAYFLKQTTNKQKNSSMMMKRNVQTMLLGKSTNGVYHDCWTDLTIPQMDESAAPQVLGIEPTSNKLKEYKETMESHFRCIPKDELPSVLESERYHGHPLYLDHLDNHPSINIVKVSYGSIHILMLTDKGVVYALGYNDDSECGDSQKATVTLPTLIAWFVEKEIEVSDILAIGWTSYFISKDRQLYYCGRLLADPSSSTVSFMAKLTIDPVEPVRVFGAGTHSLYFQTKSYNLYACGNIAGATCTQSSTPHKIQYRPNDTDSVLRDFDFPIRTITSTNNSAMVLSESGKLFVVGFGQDRFIEVKYFADSNIAIKDVVVSWSGYLIQAIDGRLYLAYNSDTSTITKQVDTYLYYVDVPKYFSSDVTIYAGPRTYFIVRPDSYSAIELDCSMRQKQINDFSQYKEFELVQAAAGYYGQVYLFSKNFRRKSQEKFRDNLKNKIGRSYCDIQIHTN